ncbi:TetR/AcrR family transcriptional regulator C-terminal domain-containing protein [Streptomyces sp. NPDC047072]|uniref:TetR/AcrR family transcriptional regulator C-terminal domain-containing protein n=1 Tax=Streptomyces sp. NPDC047072 TaxID=3154809 RepID=UPI00340CAEEB
MSKTSRSAGQPGSPVSRAHVGLTEEQIVTAALEVLEGDGLDKLSLRAVAGRLGVRVNAVAWHVKDKAGLLTAVADAMMADCLPARLPRDPDERVRRLLESFRAALRSRRDGARLALAGFSLARPHALAYAEAFNAALRSTGRSPNEVAWTAWTLIHFVVGLVNEEQTSPDRTPGTEAAAADPALFPSLAEAITHLTKESFDGRFTYGVDLILTGRSAVRTTD